MRVPSFLIPTGSSVGGGEERLPPPQHLRSRPSKRGREEGGWGGRAEGGGEGGGQGGEGGGRVGREQGGELRLDVVKEKEEEKDWEMLLKLS